ncbi:hypothetical protein PVAP13_3KG312800 [Panicum virgatum]|uniref:Uncharacterized protein n=1 Tax=Panicum virgatum TaxID=38727 RepID=A0A8T0UNJ2_PANVG|nr:hypothetical protein PVAP13_3KG312800 [Panicum virgatum]
MPFSGVAAAVQYRGGAGSVKVATRGHRAPQNQHRTKQEARVDKKLRARAASASPPTHPAGEPNGTGKEAGQQASSLPKSRALSPLAALAASEENSFPHPRRLAATSLIPPPRPAPHFFLLVRPSTAAPLPLPHAQARSPPRSLEGWKKSSADGRRERGLLGEEKKGNLGGFPFREILAPPVAAPPRAAPAAGLPSPPGPPRRASSPPGNVWPSFAAANVAVRIGRVLLTPWSEKAAANRSRDRRSWEGGRAGLWPRLRMRGAGSRLPRG